MTLTPNPRVRVKVRVRVRVRVGKVRKPYPNFQMVLLSMTLSDLWPTFQCHDNIQRPITRLIVSRVWSVQWFRFQWPWVTLNVDFKATEMPSTNCVRSWRAICLRWLSSCCSLTSLWRWFAANCDVISNAQCRRTADTSNKHIFKYKSTQRAQTSANAKIWNKSDPKFEFGFSDKSGYGYQSDLSQNVADISLSCRRQSLR